MKAVAKATVALVLAGSLPAAGLAAGQTANPDPSLARTIVEEGKPKEGVAPCQSCHGADGHSPVPMYPHLAGQYRDYLVQALKRYRSGARQDPTMNEQAKHLTDAEIQALAAYFSSRDPVVRPLSLR